MNIFGVPFEINNKIGYYAFFSLLILLLLYFMRPKPLKRVIPSLIFLEKSDKKINMMAFFKKFIKDWLLLLQAFLLILLSLAALDLTAEFLINKVDSEAVFVIDASASSKALSNGRQLLDIYKDIAKKKIGLSNTIILIKSNPQILVKQTNPVSARAILNSIKPSDSLSNIWDSMMLASNIAGEKATIIVLSDFVDTNNKDILLAKKIIEAKGIKVELVSPKGLIENIGIVDYKIFGNSLKIDIKNFDTKKREIKIDNEKIFLEPFSIKEHTLNASDKIIFKIETNDDFKVDDSLYLVFKEPQNSVLFVSNKKKSFSKAAFESVPNIDLKTEEPPIISIGNQNIIVFSELNYNSILPGTIEKIKEHIYNGNSLIIFAQEDLNTEKLGDLLPLEIEKTNQDINVMSTNAIKELKDFNFGLSTKYYKASLLNNSSIIIAEANDKQNSPVIVLSKYGKGNILFYGIFDDSNSFKSTPQYPLFWIKALNILNSREVKSNYRIGEIIYGDNIIDSEGISHKNYLQLEKTGLYKVDGMEIGVNLLNPLESDFNNYKSNVTEQKNVEIQKIKYDMPLLAFIIILIISFSFLEIYILKRRGEL